MPKLCHFYEGFYLYDLIWFFSKAVFLWFAVVFLWLYFESINVGFCSILMTWHYCSAYREVVLEYVGEQK